MVLPRDTVRVGGGPRPRWPSAIWCSAAAPPTSTGGGPSRTPSCSTRCRRSSAATRCSSTTRSRACRPGSPYEVRLAVRKQGGGGGLFRKIFGGGGAALSLKFDAQAVAVESAHRGLQLDRLKPGNYVLEVTVADDQGRKDQRRRRSRWWRSSLSRGRERRLRPASHDRRLATAARRPAGRGSERAAAGPGSRPSPGPRPGPGAG